MIMNPKFVMISQPMANKTEEEILKEKEEATKKLESLGYSVVNSYFDDPLIDTLYHNVPLAYLAKSLEVMAQCDALYMCNGWENARGCIIEHKVATDYGLEVIYEK